MYCNIEENLKSTELVHISPRQGKALADPAVCEDHPLVGGGGGVKMYRLPTFVVVSFGLDSVLTEDSILDPCYKIGYNFANSYRGAPFIKSWRSLLELSTVPAPT